MLTGLHGHERRGGRQHGVAAEYGCVLIPLAVDSGASTAHVGVVHHIVVEEGEVMEHLKSEGLIYGHLWRKTASIGRGETEYGTEVVSLRSREYIQWGGIDPRALRENATH